VGIGYTGKQIKSHILCNNTSGGNEIQQKSAHSYSALSVFCYSSQPNGPERLSQFSIVIGVCVGHSSQTRFLSFQRLHSLALGFGTFAYAKDQAFLSRDGLLMNTNTDSMVFKRQSQIVKSHASIDYRRVFCGIVATDVPSSASIFRVPHLLRSLFPSMEKQLKSHFNWGKISSQGLCLN